jgi:hypothetical protein
MVVVTATGSGSNVFYYDFVRTEADGTTISTPQGNLDISGASGVPLNVDYINDTIYMTRTSETTIWSYKYTTGVLSANGSSAPRTGVKELAINNSESHALSYEHGGLVVSLY